MTRERSSSYARRHVWHAAAAIALLLAAPPRTSAADRTEPPSTVTDLAALERAFATVIDQVSPSVVALRGTRTSSASDGSTGFQVRTEDTTRRVIVNGAGTIISAEGLILTNEHVVANCDSLIARLSDGTELAATVISADPRSDLAIVRVERSGLTPARYCTWPSVGRGQWCIAMGNPYGLASDGSASVAIGVISNLHRQLPGLGEDDDRFYYDMIQTTASIHPGHSGGPLFNLKGELVGVVTAMHTHAAGDDGVGFATPLNDAKRRLVDRLAAGQPIEYGYVGALVRTPTASERESAGRPGGVIVQRIESDGPADRASLSVGDLVLNWDGQSIWAPGQFAELVGQTQRGTQVPVILMRDGKRIELSVDVEARDAARAALLRATGVVMGPR